MILFYINEEGKKNFTPPFHETHVTCYIKFKLLYKFRIIDFYFLSKYKCNAYIIETCILK